MLAGCASTVTTLDGRVLRPSSAEFRGYVESVFREQNAVATELAFAQADAAGVLVDELGGLEDELLRACAGVNALAVANRDGRSAGVVRGAAMAATAPDCEAAAARARSRLAALR